MRVFDLHCDTLTLSKRKGWGFDNQQGQLRLDDMAGYEGYTQVFAVFIPDGLRGQRAADYFSIHHAYYRRQLQELAGRVLDIDGLQTLAAAGRRQGISALLAIEGGAVFAGELENVRTVYNAGVRCVTLTWNGENELAGGMLSKGRLTPFGRAAIAEMERLGIAVDVSHLNDESFYEVLEAASRPVLATHSNSRAVCGHRRNLTDEQFTLLAGRGGVVGLNFAKDFLSPGGREADMDALVRHVLHFLELGGEDALALGSDYDGADVAPCVDRPLKLRALYAALLGAGLGETQVDKIFYRNAQRYFEDLLRAAPGPGPAEEEEPIEP